MANSIEIVRIPYPIALTPRYYTEQEKIAALIQAGGSLGLEKAGDNDGAIDLHVIHIHYTLFNGEWIATQTLGGSRARGKKMSVGQQELEVGNLTSVHDNRPKWLHLHAH